LHQGKESDKCLREIKSINVTTADCFIPRNNEKQNHFNKLHLTHNRSIKTTAEAKVVPKPNQQTRTGTRCYRSRLDFSLVIFFASRQRK
jgi:hypothetical protein